MDFEWSEQGSYYWTHGPDFENLGKDRVVIAVSTISLQNRVDRGVRAQLGQCFGIVSTGLINAVAVHKGLARGMMVGEDQNAHREKFAVVLNPSHDAVMVGDEFSSEVKRINAPENQVFVVYVSPNKKRAEFPSVDYWVEHWAWADADGDDPRQPFGFKSRYDEPCYWERP